MNATKSLMPLVIMNDTYFGIIVEYAPSIEYIRSLCHISKYHYQFAQNEHYNFNIITRILSREFFNLKDNNLAELINVSSDNIYQSIWIIHHFYKDMMPNMKISNWMKQDFWCRWRYITSNSNVELYGIKYWIKSMANSKNISIGNLWNFNESENKKPKIHISTAMILQSNMNGFKKNKFDVHKCSELMDFCIKNGFSQTKITQFRQLIICTLDINKKRDGINCVMFAWSINYLLNYFENNLQDFSIYFLQDFSAMITELILILHTAKVEHNIIIPSDQYKQLNDALNTYSIQKRMKHIWSTLMGGNMINFTAGFSLRVSAFFNGLMGLSTPE